MNDNKSLIQVENAYDLELCIHHIKIIILPNVFITLEIDILDLTMLISHFNC